MLRTRLTDRELLRRIYEKLIRAGVDCMTLGDHIYRRAEIIPVLIDESNVVKPANFPDSAPGRSWTMVRTAGGIAVGVFTVLGRVYMRPTDCPFAASDRVLREMPADVVVRLVDVHAEATSDKQLLGRYLDGRVSAVLGTHTHVATADEQILPGGTAFQCDVGMTGPFDSILGRKVEARAGNDHQLPANAVPGGHRRRAAVRHHRRCRPADRPLHCGAAIESPG